MQERHFKREKYFEEQIFTTEKYVIPFIGDDFFSKNKLNVLEIGSGEGGNMKPFLDKGYKVTGVELEAIKNEWATDFFSYHPNKNNLTLICDDIYNFKKEAIYDLIIIRDVVEHIHNQERFIPFIKDLLSENGRIFFAFPPWYNPFGGHQQVCKNKLLSILPFYHILPKSIYKNILRLGKETDGTIEGLLEIKDTGISIERFKKIVSASKYNILNEAYFLINPNYKIKFGLKPRIAWKIFSKIPYLRNFYITSYYCVLTK